MPTFAELGIPFALYDADVATCADYAGEGRCALCGHEGHVFRFGIGGHVVVPCDRCGVALEAHVPDGSPTCACGGRATSVPLGERAKVLACHGCVRAGRAMRTQVTELGTIGPEHAREGLTHGVPGLDPSQVHASNLPLVAQPDEPEWMRARVDVEDALELVRTPTFHTWQGAVWMFHCGRPMVFVGEWKEAELVSRSNGTEAGARELLASLVPDASDDLYDALDRAGGVYAFRCGVCGALRGSYDMD